MENYEIIEDVIEAVDDEVVEEGMELITEVVSKPSMNKFTKGSLIALGVGAVVAGGAWFYKKMKNRKVVHEIDNGVTATVTETVVVEETEEDE